MTRKGGRRPCCARGASESPNVEGAYLEVMADTVGSVGVIVAGVLVAATGQALTSGMHVATAHLVTGEEADDHAVLDQARDLLRERRGIARATLQVEPASHTGCAEVGW